MQNSVPEEFNGMNEFTGLQSQQPSGSQNYGATEPTTRTAQFLKTPVNISAKRSYLAVGVLCYINLLNYMDWFIVAGVLLDIKTYFKISDGWAGFLHTVFIFSFLLSAPFFGYLGDRYNRKIILSVGIFLWSGATLGSSFVTESYPWIFFVSRAFVGIGTSSYSTIAPTIIADLFEGDQRTCILSVFYIFIPVGSGFGYVLASGVTQAVGHWHWAFRITPCMGVIALALLILLVPDPTQHASEGHGGRSITSTTQGADKEHGAQSTACTTWRKDIKSLSKNRSFIWSSLGVTAISFVTGALGLWMPLFLYRAQLVHDLVPPCLQEPCSSSNSLIFGAITIVTGVVGVITGGVIARRYKKINPKADPLICAVGMLSFAPCLYLSIMLASQSIHAAYIFIALGEFLLSLNWAIVADILLVLSSLSNIYSSGALLAFDGIDQITGGAVKRASDLVAYVVGSNLAEFPDSVWSKKYPQSKMKLFFMARATDNVGETTEKIAEQVSAKYVVVPKCQSTAVALQISVSHLLGDTGSPYLIGIVSDAIQARHSDSYLGAFRSLQYSFILCAFVGVLGGGFFLLTALYVEEDRKEAQQFCRGTENKGYVSSEDELQDELPKA